MIYTSCPRRQFLNGISVVVGALALTGCSSGGESKPTTAAEALKTWRNQHEKAERKVDDRYAGAYSLYEEGRYSEALVDFKKASDAFGALESDAEKLANNHDSTTPPGEMFSGLRWFYYNMKNAAAAGYLSSSSMNKGNTAEADEHFTTLQIHEAEAEEQVAQLNELLEDAPASDCNSGETTGPLNSAATSHAHSDSRAFE